MFQLYLTDIHPLSDPQLFQLAWERMAPPRQQKVALASDAADKQRSLAAGLLQAYVERQHPGCYSNLSHCGQLAVCAVAEAPIGVDIEQLRGDIRIAAFARRYFSPAEQDYLFSFADAERQQRAFFRIWVLKESFLKATGHGLALPLDSFSCEIGETVQLRQQVDTVDYDFWESSFADYFLAVCTTRPARPALAPSWLALPKLLPDV